MWPSRAVHRTATSRNGERRKSHRIEIPVRRVEHRLWGTDTEMMIVTILRSDRVTKQVKRPSINKEKISPKEIGRVVAMQVDASDTDLGLRVSDRAFGLWILGLQSDPWLCALAAIVEWARATNNTNFRHRLGSPGQSLLGFCVEREFGYSWKRPVESGHFATPLTFDYVQTSLLTIPTP